MTDPLASDGLVILGRVVGLYGIRGWVKVHAETRERAGILDYDRWLLHVDDEWREFAVHDGRVQGRGLVAQLGGIEDRNQASALVGAEIAVRRSQLPRLAAGEYYWAELEGFEVVNDAGVTLGTVSHLFETGANDVMVVTGERERLIPFVGQVVKSVDREARVIRVEWDADF